jgi:hypothetical protein
MDHVQCANVFPDIGEFRNVAKIGVRLFAISKNISNDDMIVLSKLAELCGQEFPLDLLQWLFLVMPKECRKDCIEEYKKLIVQVEKGEVAVGTLKEAFEEPDAFTE